MYAVTSIYQAGHFKIVAPRGGDLGVWVPFIINSEILNFALCPN